MILGIAAVRDGLERGTGQRRHALLMVILAGMVVSSLFSALVSLVKYACRPPGCASAISYWLMGSMASTTRATLVMGALFILIGNCVLFLLRWKLNSVSLPEDEARS